MLQNEVKDILEDRNEHSRNKGRTAELLKMINDDFWARIRYMANVFQIINGLCKSM